MERLRQLFTRQEKKETPSHFGHITIGGENTGKLPTIVPITNRFIIAGSLSNSTSGEIPSNLTGLITSVHMPIELTIKPPADEATLTAQEDIDNPQIIGNMADYNQHMIELFDAP